MMGENMQGQCMSLEKMNIDNNGHMEDMSPSSVRMDESDGPMMDMSSFEDGMGKMKMNQMCAWHVE